MDETPDNFLDIALRIEYINKNVEFGKLRKPFKKEWWKNVTFVTGTMIEYEPKRNTLSKSLNVEIITFRKIYIFQKEVQLLFLMSSL